MPHCSALWARATKNVKKPPNQMCESCRKAWVKIFAYKKNKKSFANVQNKS